MAISEIKGQGWRAIPTQWVSSSLTSPFSTNMAISETKGQGWRTISTQWRKASDILTSILAAFLCSSYPKKERDRETHLNYYDRVYNKGRQLSHRKKKLNQIRQKKHASKNTFNTKATHTKTKARFSHLLRHPAWKWSETILIEWKGMKKQEKIKQLRSCACSLMTTTTLYCSDHADKYETWNLMSMICSSTKQQGAIHKGRLHKCTFYIHLSVFVCIWLNLTSPGGGGVSTPLGIISTVNAGFV